MDFKKISIIVLFFVCLQMKIEISKKLEQLVQEVSNTSLSLNMKSTDYFDYKSNYLGPIYTNNKNCHSHQGYLVIQDLYRIKIQNQEEQIILNQKQNTLYRISSKSTSKLIVHKLVQDQQQLHYSINEVNRIDMKSQQCQKNMLMDNEQNYLYIFSCSEISRINQSSIVNSKPVQLIYYEEKSYFYGSKVKSIGDLIFWMSSQQGLKIFGLEINGNITQVDSITKSSLSSKGTKIVDFNYYKGYLFLLSEKQGVYLYRRKNNNKFEFVNEIELEPKLIKNNFEILISQNTMLISIMSNSYYFVVQIQIHPLFPDSNFHIFSLVRYFKGFRHISTIKIHQQKLLIFSQRGIQLYPLNQDPRKISALMNGVTNNHFKSIIAATTLKSNIFALVQLQVIRIVRLQIAFPYLECKFQQGIHEVQVRQTCNELNRNRYFQHCQKHDILKITVEDKENQKQWIFIILLSVALAVISVFGLIYWRSHKQFIIQGLIQEIRKLKNKKQVRVEFVQSQQQQQNRARSRDWNQFKDQISFQHNQDIQQEQDSSHHQRNNKNNQQKHPDISQPQQNKFQQQQQNQDDTHKQNDDKNTPSIYEEILTEAVFKPFDQQ